MTDYNKSANQKVKLCHSRSQQCAVSTYPHFTLTTNLPTMNSVLLLGLLALISGTAAEFTCTRGDSVFPKKLCYDEVCANKVVGHIEEEFHAAFKYLYMAAMFGQYSIARPGITKFLLESASEERSHAMQMLDYLDTRGISGKSSYNFLQASVWTPTNGVDNENGIEAALEEAIKMEIGVTSLIKEVIAACSDDYHAADVFTNPILDEQHEGLRKLQGALKTLKGMKVNPITREGKMVAEYFFDLKLQSGEIL